MGRSLSSDGVAGEPKHHDEEEGMQMGDDGSLSAADG